VQLNRAVLARLALVVRTRRRKRHRMPRFLSIRGVSCGRRPDLREKSRLTSL
jgi:hypothetical protein